MALRNGRPGTDSLELLLDTVCNVFGGMILMAILIVILTQGAARHLPEPRPEEEERALRARQLISQIDHLEATNSNLKQEKTELSRQVERIGDRGMSSLNIRREQLVRDLESAEQRLQTLADDIDDSSNQREKTDSALAETKRRLDARKATIEELKERTRRSQSVEQEKVRLPHRRGATGKREFVCYIKGPHLFFTESKYCQIRRGLFSISIKPKEGQGYRISMEENAGPALAAIKRKTDPRTSYLNIFVYDTDSSFKAFLRLKGRILSEGYRYRVSPMTPDDAGWITMRVGFSPLPTE